MRFHLYIMRHAKSDWSLQGGADFDRPINERGQKNAAQVGQWMVANNHRPEKIISSSALRARQTIELVSKQLDTDPAIIHYDNDLYLASLDVLLECIQLYKTNVKSLMLVAHNPGLEYLVNDMLSRSVNADLGGKAMTTANLVVFEFKDSDFDPEKDQGKLVEFIKPKELS